MNQKKNKAIVIAICVFFTALQLSAQSINEQKRADEAYKAIYNFPPEFNSVRVAGVNLSRDSTDRAIYIKCQQLQNIHIREWGLKFWNHYPNDYRRYIWFLSAMKSGLYYYYWKNIDMGIKQIGFEGLRMGMKFRYSVLMDDQALSQWENVYPDMRKAFLNYYKRQDSLENSGNRIYASYRNNLDLAELQQFLRLSLNKEYNKANGGKIDLLRLRQLINYSAEIFKGEDIQKQEETLKVLDNGFIARYPQYGLLASEMNAFFDSFKMDPCSALRLWAQQRRTLFALMEKPLEFKHIAIDGRIIDLKELHGRVVLIDFWATWCSGCIARMPAIKAVYDKYKQDGFEVVSVSLNQMTELEEVKKIKEKIGADWPTLIIGGETLKDLKHSLRQKIMDTYGFYGVPQLLLLDKKGKLLILNDVLRYGNFEPIVEKALAEKY